MHFPEIFTFLALCLFFIALPIALLYFRDRAAAPEDTLFRYSSSENHISFPWGKIWVYDSQPSASATTPTVVFIHSIGSSIYSWRYQIPEFQKKYRVIAFDLLGFGKSDKPSDQEYNLDAQEKRILALLDELKIESCAVVGCSLGGALALWLSAQHPKRFSHVAVIAPAATNTVVPFINFKHHALNPIASRIMSRSVIRVALRNGYGYKKNITPEVIENYFSPFSEPNGTYCFLRTVETLKDPRIFKSLHTITIPTLILWGKKDRVVLHKDIQSVFDELPNAIKQIHSTGGHHLMEDEPQWTNEKIFSFLDERHFLEGKTVPLLDLV